MLTYHDPRAEIGVHPDPYTLGIDLKRYNSARVACIANGFPDSQRFLEQIEAVLCEQLPNIEVMQLNKGNASIPAPQAILDKVKDCQVAIAAYGH